MFRVEPHQLLFVYAALGVAFIFLVALIHTIRRTRQERSALRNLLHCGMCGFEFRNEHNLVNPRCPNCEALVDPKRKSGL